MKKKLRKYISLENLDKEIDFSNIMRSFQNKLFFGCSFTIIFITLLFAFFSSRKWIAFMDVNLISKNCINFGLINFSDTRVRGNFYKETLNKETFNRLIQNESELLRSEKVLKDLYEITKSDMKKYEFSNKKSFQEFKDNFNFELKAEDLRISYKSKNKSEARDVLDKYVQIFKSFSSQKRKSNYEMLSNSYAGIVSKTTEKWVNSLYQLTEFLKDKKIYGQSYDIPLLEKDVILKEYYNKFKTESLVNQYENKFETNIKNASIHHISMNFLYYKKRLEKLNHYIRNLNSFNDYDLSNNYITIILPELKDTMLYRNIERKNKKLLSKSNKFLNRKNVNLLSKKNSLSKAFREKALINLQIRKDLVNDTLLEFGNYEKYMPEFVEKLVTFKSLGEQLRELNVFASKLKVYNSDYQYNHHNFTSVKFTRGFSLKKYVFISALISILISFVIILIKENFLDNYK